MMTYKYRVIRLDGGTSVEYQTELNTEAENGWRVISVYDNPYQRSLYAVLEKVSENSLSQDVNASRSLNTGNDYSS